VLKHKFRAIPTELDGIKFASRKEARRYKELRLLEKSGELLFFLRQVPFHLPANVKYVCDFLCFWQDDTVTIEDVKGIKTPLYVLKKKQVEAIYPVKIMEV
jgi:hypothetical protein